MSVRRILTPEVRKAKQELLQALSSSVKLEIQENGLTRAEAEGNLSAVISDLWMEVEQQIVRAVPARW